VNNLYHVDYEFEQVDTGEFNSILATLPKMNTVIIYGAGHHGKLICEHLERRGISVICFCDRDQNKYDKPYYGKPVISPETPYSEYIGAKIIVSVYKYQSDIQEMLIAKGVPPCDIILPPFKMVQGYIAIPQDVMPDEFIDKYALHEKDTLRATGGVNAAAPSILVYTSVYNVRESYLRRAIESVLNQTFTNFQYVILDNGNTDGSADTIREYAEKDERIEVWTFEKNIQLSRLTDIEYFQRANKERFRRLKEKEYDFKYFCVLDSDDYYMPNFLQTLYELAENHDADIVAGRTKMYLEEKPDIFYLSGAPLGKNIYRGKRQIIGALLNHTFIWRVVWGKLIRLNKIYLQASSGSKNSLSHNKFNIVGDATDTLNNFIRLELCDTVVMTNQILHHHTIRSQAHSKTMRKDSRAITRMYYLFQWLMDFVERSDAANKKNLSQIKDFVFECIFHLDLSIINNTKDTNPELTIEVIRYISQQEIPKELKRDERADIMLARLNEILADAERILARGNVQ